VLQRLGTTPARLRLLTAAAVVLSLGFGATGLLGLLGKAGALERARAENSSQTRLQAVRTALVVADSAAGVDVLLGPQAQRMTPNDFRWALVPAAVGLVAVARADDDVPGLAAADLRLTEYTSQAGAARELARLSRPEAAARLGTASALLRAEVLPRLERVQGAGAKRLREDADDSAASTAAVLAGGAVAVVLLVGGQIWLARRTRRLVNAGLATGLVLVAALTVAAVAVTRSSDRQAQEVRAGSFLLAQHLADARIAAFDARAVESLGVVQGDVPGAEATWLDAVTRARAALDRATATGTPGVADEIDVVRRYLGTYVDVHGRLLEAARSGDRGEARRIAVSPTVEGAPGSFEDVDTFSAALLARQAQLADDGWDRAHEWLVPVAWACLLAGCGAAALAAGGMAPRLREYL